MAVLAVGEETLWWVVWNYLGGAFTLALYLGMASQAGRFLVDAQRSGLIELLLATPLTARRIVQGQWRAWVRMFGLPLMLCLAMQFLGSFMAQRAWSGIAATVTTAPTAVGTTTNAIVTTQVTVVRPASPTASAAGNWGAPNQLAMVATSVAGTFAVAANLVALIWFGMWMGLNSKNTSLATLKTILFVQIIPWFVISFVSSVILLPLMLWPTLNQALPMSPQIMTWYPLLTAGAATALCLIKDLAFSLWARRKLYSEFRERASRAGVPFPMGSPPVPPMKAPPVIPPAQAAGQ